MIERFILDPKTRAVCIREMQKSLDQSSKLLIEDMIASLGVDHLFRVRDQWIETPQGGVIIFQGMQNHTAASIQSLQGYDIAWCEEAQSISRKSLTMLCPTLRAAKSELWFSWNPTSPKDPVDLMFRGDEKPQMIPELANDYETWMTSKEVNYESNPWFPPVLRMEMELDRKRDPEKYAHVWLGQYQQKSQARVFHNWTVEDFTSRTDARFYYGADWGFSVDPTVLVRCYVDGRKLYVDYEAWQVGCEIDKTPELFDRIKGSRDWPITADSANPQSISYMEKHGFPKIKPSVKGVGSVEEGVEFLKGYDIVVHPRCKNVIDELTLYSYEIDKQTGDVLPRLADKKNHTIDSLRYAVEGIRRANPPAAFGYYGTQR